MYFKNLKSTILVLFKQLQTDLVTSSKSLEIIHSCIFKLHFNNIEFKRIQIHYNKLWPLITFTQHNINTHIF